MFIIIAILLIALIIFCKPNNRENARFNLDPLRIPDNPSPINELQTRNLIRIVGIERNMKLDAYGRVESITYKKPEPESGQTSCYKVKCPSWMTSTRCWKCV